jgi:hypothetical protein
MLDADRLEGGLAQVVYLVVLMIAPVLGASAVAYSQASASKEERQQVLIPYVFWAAAGLVGVLLFLVSGTRTGSDDLAPPVVRIAFWAVFAFMWVVPVIVPLLRTIMWLLSPPIFDKVAQGPDFDR